jgi:transposase
MGSSVLKIHRSQAEDIRKLLTSNQDYLVGARLYLVYLVALGHSSRKIAELHDISFKQITTWVHRYEKEGLSGLRDRKGRGRKQGLSEEQLVRLKDLIVNEMPEDHDFSTSSRWTGPLLAKWIKREYGVNYQKAQIYNLLRKAGITFKKKQGLALEN